MTQSSDGGSFHLNRPGLRKLLGDHEADVMQAIWERGPVGVTVREIHEALAGKRDVAYTTVMTIMGNLAKKGLLRAERVGKAHVYYATQTYDQFTETAVARIVDELMRDFAAPAIAHFQRAIRKERP
ncbi:MAG TPA: BlaI/MecI/CopY family transcriptional regulator [Oscillatoriaceae cyanobacterium]